MDFKRAPRPLDMRLFKGRSGTNYLVIPTPDGGFHVFAEVEAKAAAVDCGSERFCFDDANTRQHWASLFQADDQAA